MPRDEGKSTQVAQAAEAAEAAQAAQAHRTAALAMSPETFRALGHRLVDQIAERLAAIPNGPVTRGEQPKAIRAALGLGGPLPERGEDAAALLERTTRLLFEHSLFNGHPRFMGYITSSPAPIGILADLLASAVNPNVGAYSLSPAATEIEAETVRWIAELIGYPKDCGGILVSGGNMANFMGFFAARAAKAPWDIREQGAAGASRLRVYTSAETHTWIQKAADLSGLGTSAVRWIPTDVDQRMDMEALREQVEADRKAGDVPIMVIGTAGSVSTGAVDPLPEIAKFCREQHLWFHVDGAYGALAAAVGRGPQAEAGLDPTAAGDAAEGAKPLVPSELLALSEADSVAVDPHKWLYAPLEAGCALVRDPAKLVAAFSYRPVYYHLEEEATNYVEYGMQNSRGFRALKVWLALRHAGAEGYRQMIADDIRLSGDLGRAVAAQQELELYTQELSITTFRYIPQDLRRRVASASEPGDTELDEYLNKLNQEVLDRLQKGGEAFVSPAVIDGRYLLRACIVNFHTDVADVEALPGIVIKTGRAVDQSLRPTALRRE